MKTVVLTGMMGSGKTTIGKILADNIGTEFYDIDLLIEKQENSSIPEIFAAKGEKYFRQIEEETVKKIFNPENLVISLGGGAFENQNTREFLLNNANVIYLKTSPDVIFERIKNNSSRPLLQNNFSVEKIEQIINTRKQNYELSHFSIVTDKLTPQKIAGKIKGVLS